MHFEKRQKKRLLIGAFTLVEMLVVVAIIVILAALLIPAIGRGVENSREAKCLGNVRTMTAAALMWIADNGPHAYPTGYHSDGTQIHWDAEMVPAYLPALLRCPSKPSDSASNPYGYDYGWRYSVHGIAADFGLYTATRALMSRMVLVGEMYYSDDGLSSGYHLTATSNGYTTGGIKQSHMGGLNLGFADGHAELVQAPKDAQGNVNWWYSPTYTHNINDHVGCIYDVTQWFYIANGYNSW